MSKQHRPLRKDGSAPKAKAGEGAAVQNEQLLGNQAVAQQIEGAELAQGQDVVLEAQTLIERGFFALYAEPRPQKQIERWVNVIEGSKLSTDRKAILVDKLVGDQEVAVAAQVAAERWFGGADIDAVAAGLTALDRVSSGLEQARSAELKPDALIAELAVDQGEAVVGFCREVYLILGFQDEEEEEEEELGGDLTPELL